MNKILRQNTNRLTDNHTPGIQINKSPLKPIHTINTIHPTKSPLRSRTPVRFVSPINNKSTITAIKYISNVSPLKEKVQDRENQSEISNGKSIKSINNQIIDKNY
jgi:hypothetical protein